MWLVCGSSAQLRLQSGAFSAPARNMGSRASKIHIRPADPSISNDDRRLGPNHERPAVDAAATTPRD
jgi:hypothetical protein